MTEPDPDRTNLLAERYAANAQTLTKAERCVVDHIMALEPGEIAFASAGQLAEATGTSDATVIRAARRLGFSGLPQLKREVTRAVATAIPIAKRIEQRVRRVGSDIDSAKVAVFEAAQEVLQSTADALDHAVLERAVERLRTARSVLCLGLGNSEAPAHHCAINLGRAGWRTRFSSRTGFPLADDLLQLERGDAIIVFQASESPPDIETIIAHARSAGLSLILISGAGLHQRHGSRADVALVCLGVQSRLASWSLGAMTVADLIVYCLIARNPQKAIDTQERLQGIRSQLT